MLQSCKLCFKNTDKWIDIASDEGNRQQISSVLYKHLCFCFQEEPKDGYVCRKCWLKIESFHEYYLIIEALHNSLGDRETDFFENYVQSNLVKDEPANLYENDNDSFSDDRFDADDRFDNQAANNTPDISKLLEVQCASPAAPIKKEKQKKIKRTETKVEHLATQAKRPKRPKRLKTVKSNVSEIFRCNQCELTFLTEFKLYVHVKEIHLAFPFKCKHRKCVESYSTQEQLDEHIKNNHSRAECPHCHKHMTSYYLPTHIKLYHDKDQRIVCDLCGHVSHNIYLHQSHHNLTHEVQTRLQCDICKEWSRNKHSLREHMRTRHIQKPETCNICGRVSANKTALQRHIKFHSIEQRQKYKCTICGHGFRDTTKLREHSYIHSGISDVYRCNNCDKTFRFSSSMSAHRKKCRPSEIQ